MTWQQILALIALWLIAAALLGGWAGWYYAQNRDEIDQQLEELQKARQDFGHEIRRVYEPIILRFLTRLNRFLAWADRRLR